MFNSEFSDTALYNNYGADYQALSKAVIVNSAYGGMVLWYTGSDITEEIECLEASAVIEDLGFKGVPFGISVWEGNFSDGCYSKPKGKFRNPTTAEWEAIRNNKSPWESI